MTAEGGAESRSGETINLNPGTLGTPSPGVRQAMADFHRLNLAYPLGHYQQARLAQRTCREISQRVWPFAGHLALAGSTSATLSLLTLALPSTLAKRGGEPLRVWSTCHEHPGGIGGFERSAHFEVSYLPLSTWTDPQRLLEELSGQAPDLVFLSHMTWTEASVLPIQQIFDLLHQHAPRCWRVLDVAQSLGVLPLPLDGADVVVGSAHKWLAGPPGTGFLWLSTRARECLPELYPAGEPLDMAAPLPHFEPTGGQDFAGWAGLREALREYEEGDPARVLARSTQLAQVLSQGLEEVFARLGVEMVWRHPQQEGVPHAPVLVASFAHLDPYPLYVALGQRGIHVKCIKAQLRDGQVLNLLRMGVPPHETPARMSRVIEAFDTLLREPPLC